mmetsp:Transcript_12145/g.33414  ORF Transcript_12145/g.33414 Transcript_12145/m.33414 type:complete len:124 (+) Transcript_12145:1767-2138(+)
MTRRDSSCLAAKLTTRTQMAKPRRRPAGRTFMSPRHDVTARNETKGHAQDGATRPPTGATRTTAIHAAAARNQFNQEQQPATITHSNGEQQQQQHMHCRNSYNIKLFIRSYAMGSIPHPTVKR